MGAVYLVQNRYDGRAYVGMTVHEDGVRGRYKSLGYPQKSRGTRPIDVAFREHGGHGFTFQDLMTGLTIPEMDFWERFFIKVFDATNPEVGYNADAGGYRDKGHTEAAKEKNRIAHLGKKQSLETIQKRVLALRGQKRTPEQIARMGNKGWQMQEWQREFLRRINTGRKKSAETRLKLSAAGKGKKLSVQHADILRLRHTKIRTWEHQAHGIFTGSASDMVARFPGQRLWNCQLGLVANGKIDHHKGWRKL